MKIVLDLNSIADIFNTPFFSGISTIITGLIALSVYNMQKRDEKIRAARILLLEISDCESLLDSLKNQGVNLVNTRKIISTNSWENYKHLFALDLDDRDLKLIDNFYQQCNLLNFELEEAYNLPNHTREKARIMIERHANFSENSINKDDYDNKKRSLDFFEKDAYWYQANAPKENLLKRIQMIQNITSTSAVEKIKKISKL